MSLPSRMSRSLLALLSITLLLLLSFAPTQAARPTGDQTAAATSNGIDAGDTTLAFYTIRLQGAPLATAGIAPTRNIRAGLRASIKPDFNSPAARTYQARLASQRQNVLTQIRQKLGVSVKPVQVFDTVLNGMAVQLTGAQAAKIAKLPGVVSVQREQFYTLTTDYGPQWIGADKIWDGSATGTTGYKGEGVVVGIIDSGINTTHPSFAAVGGDGYQHINPLGAGKHKGACDPANLPSRADGNPSGYNPAIICNDKLIGTWTFTRTFEVGSPTGEPSPNDSDGHGSHVASTVAGNVYLNAQVNGVTFPRISGVAPHANIIAYDVCGYKTASGTTSASCPGVAILAAIEQATKDSVDVINMSISGGLDPWGDNTELAFLAARAAGVVVAVSAGNDGPKVGSVNHASPWLLSVAATTHNRRLVGSLTNISSTDGMTLTNLTGQSIGAALTTSAVLVYAGDAPISNQYCTTFTDSQKALVAGKIVICDRGGPTGRVEKSVNVKAAGGAGFVLANDANNGNSLNSDAYPLPGVHITYSDGVTLKQWIKSHPNAAAQITATQLVTSPSFGDVLASFSSLGPNPVPSILKPDIAAPGLNIVAAYENTGSQDEFNVISGTSMASPHTAGTAALIAGLHPNWTPGQIQSALTTTSKAQVTKASGSGVTTPFESGAGRVQVDQAAQAGLVLDETVDNFTNADPFADGDPRTLNIPSFADPACVQICTWSRTVKSTLGAPATWTASSSAISGTLTVSPASFTIQPGATQTFTVTYNLSGVPVTGAYIFGSVSFSATGDVAPAAHFPVAVKAAASDLKTAQVQTSTTSTFSYTLPIKTIAFGNLGTTTYGLTKGTPVVRNLAENEEYVTSVTVPAGAARLVADITRSTSQDIDLYIYKDSNGNGTLETNADTQVCSSATGAVLEYCTLSQPTAGTYFVRILNFLASSEGASDPTKLVTAVVPSTSSGNFTVSGPATSAGGTSNLTVTVNEPSSVVGDAWYGWFKLNDTTNSQSLGSSNFDFYHISGPPVTATLPNGNAAETIKVDNGNGSALTVVVKDAQGKPVEGEIVTFTTPTSGASAIIIAPLNPLKIIQNNSNPSAGAAVTDANGAATVWVKSNGVAGTYAITATVNTAGGVKTVTFNVTNQRVIYLPITRK